MPSTVTLSTPDESMWMRRALRLALRGYGATSPNPMVGAVLVRDGRMIGCGWHRRPGGPHAEVEAIQDALAKGNDPSGATLFVTLEPCSTQGRTPPCTDAIVRHGISRVVAGATDPNPNHAGRGYAVLREAGVQVSSGIVENEVRELNAAFNHWIVHRTPFVTVKAAMSLDGKIATASGQSRWITGARSRAHRMRLRQGADAILVGVNTVLCDDPKLTVRRGERERNKALRRIILDARARTPLEAYAVSDVHSQALTTVVVSEAADSKRVALLEKRARILVAPAEEGRIDLRWLLARLGQENVTSLLVEGGGEVNASFLLGGFAHRIAFFYAPVIIGGHAAPGAVGGIGALSLSGALRLVDAHWRRLGPDFLLTARVQPPQV